MNGMANLPQFYQDIMRSHFVNALNQQNLASQGSPSSSTLLTPSSTQTNSSQGPFPDLSKLNNGASFNNQGSNFNQQQAQQVQMAAAVAAMQAQVQKQQQNNYVNQMQAQMNAVAAAAAASVSNQNNQQQGFRPQAQPQASNQNVTQSFQYPQKSFFMPSNLDQIKSTINSFYNQHTNMNSLPNNSNNNTHNFNREPQTISKENLLLQQQDLMQQHIEQASKRHNLMARNEANRNKLIQNEQNKQQFIENQIKNDNSVRGRGRPKNKVKRTPSPSPSNNSFKLNSPVSTKSRSSSPRDYKYLKKSYDMNPTQLDTSKESLKIVQSRTSTPSKFSDNINDDINDDRNSIISKSEENENMVMENMEEEFEDGNNTDVYSVIYENEQNDGEEDLEIDDVVNVTNDAEFNIKEEEYQEDEQILSKEEDLNTTTSNTKTIFSSNINNRQSYNSQNGLGNLQNLQNEQKQQPAYDFTLQALEMSLYGYLRQTDPMFASHAISGLRLPPFRSLNHNTHDILKAGSNSISLVNNQNNDFLKKENVSSLSSSSSSNSSIAISNNTEYQKSQPKKSSFSIENLLTASSSSSSSSSCSSSSCCSVSTLTQQPFNHVHQCNNPQSTNSTRTSPIGVDMDRLDLPEELQIRQSYQTDIIHYGVFCQKKVITKSTRFGPFPGKSVLPNEIKPNEDNNHMWEIFNDGRLSHFIDGRQNNGNQNLQKSIPQLSPTLITNNNQNSPNNAPNNGPNQWMIYVNCARFAQEQNMIAVQLDGEIFYEVCKDIAQGQELLVWYGDSYLQFLGIPVSLKDMTDEMSEDTSENKDGYACDRCGKVFAYKYYRDKHLKYTRCVDQGDRKFPCHLCTRSFEKRDRLRIHILHVHEKHRPHKCSVCGKSFSQSSSLNKHMRVHSGERPYKCVYCNKAFTASSILRTHIRQHSGEKPFKCKYCGKAFASHAAHDSHVRRTHNIVKEKNSNLIL